MKFTHLHVHSNYSFCRGANTIEQICAAAKDYGFSHLALTDTNGLYGLGWFLETAKRYQITPLIGAFLITSSCHSIVLAKNVAGYHVLCQTISHIHNETNFNLASFLLQYKHDVVVISDDIELLKTLSENPDDVYAELLPYGNRSQVIQCAQQNQLPLVVSNGVYMITSQDYPIHRMLRAIDLNTTLERIPNKECASPEAVLKSTEEMVALFPNQVQALENTVKIARQCSFTLDFEHPVFPGFTGSKGETADKVLEQRVKQGILWRYGKFNDAVTKRLAYEMDIIISKGFAPYFLVVSDIVKKAPRTCGRGSAAASLVSYSLGITHVDPLKYNLFFDRFLNPGRIDPPDIDVDFPWDERDDILNYIFDHYGVNHVAMISNHNSFKVRSAVREIAKIYGIPDVEIGAITKKMTGFWQPENIRQLTQSHPVFVNTSFPPPWPDIIATAERIRGYPRHLSIHCGGVVIAPQEIDHYVPVQPAKKVLQPRGIIPSSSGLPSDIETIRVIQWEKDQAEDMKLVKMDILGNRSLAVIRDALTAIKNNYNIDIDYTKWNPLNDEKTLELMKKGDTMGVFYVESPAMRLLQKKTGIGDFEHLVIHSSIIRPAANVYINEYIRRLKGGSYIPLHPLLETVLAETYGIMVYQEDVSKVVMALADFTPAEADDLRKIISKKHKQRKIKDYRQQFFRNARKKGISAEICEKIWNMILSFSGYSFCKPHSASYALVSFKSAYLRAHYPAEFMAAVLSNRGGYYSSFAYISEARRMGLKIQMPDINKSELVFTGHKNTLRIGLMQLKGINRKSLDVLLEERGINGFFVSITDFLSRVKIDPADVEILIKAGCFDAIERQSRPALMWLAKMERSQVKSSPTLSLFENDQPPTIPQALDYDLSTILRQEMETLGCLMSRHPLSLYKKNLKKRTVVKAIDLESFINKRVTTLGWFITGKVTSTKKQDLMEFISFEDTTAIYETVFFPKAFTKFVHMMSHDRPYLLMGRVDCQYGAITIMVEQIDILEPDETIVDEHESAEEI